MAFSNTVSSRNLLRTIRLHDPRFPGNSSTRSEAVGVFTRPRPEADLALSQLVEYGLTPATRSLFRSLTMECTLPAYHFHRLSAKFSLKFRYSTATKAE